jgi:hypothetical protein
MATSTIKVKRGISTAWTTRNPVLAEAEWGMETDTLKFKIGDGTKTWSNLPYFGAVTAAIAAALAEAKTYTDQLAVNGVHYKGEVANMAALQAVQNPVAGDEYLVNDDGSGHTVFAIWDGTEWDLIEINLGDYYNKTQVDGLLDDKEDAANKGVADGYASLDDTGKLPAEQLPAVIDGGTVS